VLGPDEDRLARLFGEQTGDQIDKFARCSWRAGPGGVPLLEDCPRFVLGRVLEQVALGDHVGFLLQPVAVESGSSVQGLTFEDVEDMSPGTRPDPPAKPSRLWWSLMLILNRLSPAPVGEVAAAQVYAYPSSDGSYLRVNMVSSLDGAAVLAGRVGALTGPADQRLLLELRSLCDVLLVGAGTVRAEGYGPLRTDAELADRRREEGQLAAPRLAVVSRTIDVDLGSSAFTEAVQRPLVITTELADPERVRQARHVAEVLVAGERTVDMGLAAQLLLEQGLRRMLCEGGPTSWPNCMPPTSSTSSAWPSHRWSPVVRGHG